MRTLMVSSGWQHNCNAAWVEKPAWRYAQGRRTASIAPAMPPAVMWVPKPTGLLSGDARDIFTKDTEFGTGLSDYSRVSRRNERG